MLTHKILEKLSDKKNNSLLRRRTIVEKRFNNLIEINQAPSINFSSNDYLGLAQHPQIMRAFMEGIQHYGMGSASSPLVSGYFKIQEQLEDKFSEFLNVEKTIFFNSGYSANLGVITALANKSSIIVSDKLSHASLLDGIQLSRAKNYRYKHNNMEHLSAILTEKKADLIITESVFSMEGDIAKIPEIINISKINRCNLIIDDAHAIGVLGKNGIGISEHFNLNLQDIACLVAPLGKSFACIGSVVAGNRSIIDAVLQFSRSYIYSTALPPAVCFGILASLKIVKEENWRREKLYELIQYFILLAIQKGLKLVSYDITPIKCIIFSDNAKVKLIQRELLKKGFFVSCIRPPTVPINTARIRISLNTFHTKLEIENLLSELEKFL